MKDMFQAFSGEMLIAMGASLLSILLISCTHVLVDMLGILIEEDIAHQLTKVPPPEGWDETEEVGDEAYNWPGSVEKLPYIIPLKGTGPSDEQKDLTIPSTTSEEVAARILHKLGLPSKWALPSPS